MKKFAEKNLERALDLLNERLVFERSGVAFYDKILEVMAASKDAGILQMIPQMKEHRDQEKEHEEWLEEQIRALGGDAHAETERSRLVTLEAEGIKEVIDVDFGLPHLFHALLQAELSDNAGWQLLLELADEAGDDEAREAFRTRLHHEDEHLRMMREAVSTFARRDVLGEQAVPMPTGP
ncbi:MAG TPA: ferritin-like domain-containing protein [Myxococcales bacterium]|jgi:bacterioferritin (cytochrome b1)